MRNPKSKIRILATFAHPDDESYGPAGTLARATRNGHIVSLLTFTHGESGSLGISKKIPPSELAERRCSELRNAAKELGIQNLYVHNLSDKQLQKVPEKLGISIIEYELERFKPDIVLTYHENTISGHPDHLAVTKWTLKAVKSDNRPLKLFYFGLDHEQTSKVSFLKLIPVHDNEITHRINVGSYLSEKIAAIKCHKTQNVMWHQFACMESGFQDFAKWEVFVQKWPKPEEGIVKSNLFD